MKKEDAASPVNNPGIGSFSRGGARRHMAIEEYAVDWNGPSQATEPPPRLRLLLLTDVDLASAKRVVEWALQGDKTFDLCAVCGDFVPRPEGWSTAGETEEELSAEEGEMSATLAQLENTVCRVVYIPGPLDPVMPSIRLSRTQSNNSTAAAAGAGQGLLQLTPTSKNLYRRNLRLAPGLSVAGFTEEPHQRISGSSFSFARNRHGAGWSSGQDKLTDDRTAALSRTRRRNLAASDLEASSSLHPSSGRHARCSAPGDMRRLPPLTPSEPHLPLRVAHLGKPARDRGGQRHWQQVLLPLLRPPHCTREAVTAARLRHLWAQQRQQQQLQQNAAAVAADSDDSAAGGRTTVNGDSEGGGGGDGGGDGGVGGVLLHVCAGPGAILAVREAISEGDSRKNQQQRGHGGGGGVDGVLASPILRPREGEGETDGEGLVGAGVADGAGPGESGVAVEDGSSAGIGCRIAGCTVTALGSLREHGAYCVVELAMPRREQQGGGGAHAVGSGWSVAEVHFGRVGVEDGGSECEREEANRKLAGAAAVGNFVHNYD
eukprot:g16053.t1